MVQSSSEPRRPDETRQTRLGALATLPVFYRLHGKRVVVSGGGDAAAWKAELLAATGALVDVYAPAPGEHLRDLAQDAPNVRIVARAVAADDLVGAAMALADADSEAEAERFHGWAKSAGVPVNVIDEPGWSDFQFGSIVERSPLVIAISTDGGAPVFGQALRTRIETMLPEGFRRWAQAAKAWRPRVSELKLGFQARRRLWERFTRLAFDEPQRTPTDADLEQLIAQSKSEASGQAQAERQMGSVVLVGAGPGDPELLTLRAVRALQSADDILYDDLVLPGTLELGRREARKIAVGKRGYKPSCTQEDITAMLVSLAREGRRVVRLKGGDPMIFGRAGEEIVALRAAGIPVEVVPGVTAAAAAAASIQASLTERVRARRVQFITAHARDSRLPEDLDWRALADPGATTAVYMGLKTLEPLAARLIREGLPAQTPAVIVERVSWHGERHVAGTIARLPQLALEAGLTGPCLVLIGVALEGALTSS
jgi:uroporphyrin-III C-methyltransferase/precorrin-2 dehydrogenase/sirohydrochlorin ferrochelatase